METKSKDSIRLRIKRGAPLSEEAARFDEFEVPHQEGWTIMNALNYIHEHLDPSIAYYSSCRIGKCDACDVLIDGAVELTCIAKFERDVTIEPVEGSVLIRDLVVDTSRPKRRKMGKLLGS
ncbi:MAG TPA: 2Fe-2S iron-sulfur cluster-binding protein [Rhodospirillales bacterium]|jgi:succinate dehydrogenase/fumarate reductase-like Fe-S protein|nr:2Fe-2S iron-sulfur cluster-binding protein [Rhodospirillales bacterium]